MNRNRTLTDIIIHIFLALLLIVAVPIGICLMIGFSTADGVARSRIWAAFMRLRHRRPA